MLRLILTRLLAALPNLAGVVVITFVLTRALWNAVRDIKCTGTRPISDADLKTADKLIMPSEYSQLPGFKR